MWRYSLTDEKKRMEDLLKDWHFWCDSKRSWQPKLDVPPVSLFGRLQKTTELYDDEEIDHMRYIELCEIIDSEVDNLPKPNQHAIAIVTRNKAFGLSVWSNIRYTREQTKVLYDQGVEMLAVALKKRGVLR